MNKLLHRNNNNNNNKANIFTGYKCPSVYKTLLSMGSCTKEINKKMLKVKNRISYDYKIECLKAITMTVVNKVSISSIN